MKKEDIPQDKGALGNEVSYVVDENGNYTTGISNGWNIKIEALDIAWSDIEKKVTEAKRKVLNDEASPILYFMEVKIMDLPLVAAYTGFWQWQIKRHLKPSVFNALPPQKIQKYADLFEITPEELKNAKQILSAL